MVNKKLIYDLNFSEINNLFREWDEPPYRADQLWKGLYKNLYTSADQLTVFSKSLRNKVDALFSFHSLSPTRTLNSSDGNTQKVLFKLSDNKAIETVLMVYKKRKTLCISTQAGCAMGCTFCATGQMGFQRNLSSGEIIEQVLFFSRNLQKTNDNITNVVIMGMGEPFHNYDETMKAIDKLNDPDGFGMGARRFTISTVGLVPMIRRFSQERRQINLAVSLHATNDELRSSMIPINKKYPIDELISSCKEYTEITGRRITFEWALIDNVNDSINDAISLSELLKGINCHVNVIRLNPTAGYEGRATSRQRATQFCETLNNHKLPSTIRLRRGIDIRAGCGQLAIVG